ncbi:MAG: hypothetical protein A2648_00210 [Candidatus Lloydbacteria bacterium RIFCSPHIGHO2_01_FULL_41_20]|uniref:Type 4 fimbrial biogenesis protein PilX N-terminal domain-containing protein n=1 Tax=Candidatus Lloydbacteria bacterium RIFCSPHIGHO2_01_FULL_41_20 TaxID=1798657 RepID=A0A1G2CTM5_9BACT|nr:MAG: hypothetical protein A2648_00210 [Candidatus Lloydbacteria bacterium RIFCSPHIGHO2_01_FULL_41_20]
MDYFKKFRRVNKQKGQAIITSVVFLLFISLSLMLGVSNSSLREFKITQDTIKSIQSYFTAESGNEDVSYRLKTGKQVSASQTLSLNGATTTVTVIDIGGSDKEIISSSNFDNLIRKIKTQLTVSTSGASFVYGVQVGDGGFDLQNTATIVGNVYSNGPINGANSNIVKGDIISAGSTGLISGVHATSSAYAHTITNSTIDKDAYYQTLTNTTVGGTNYPGSIDQPKSTLPISDALITQWENDAALGGTISSPCPYQITNYTTIGPKKISCDLEISGNPTVTIDGPLWVTGNITIKNSAILRINPAIGNKSIAIIADNPANRSTSGVINVENTTSFFGAGFSGSYILLVSQNNSAETGGDNDAITAKNSANGEELLVYAGHGNISLENSVSLRGVTAYKITAKNTTEVVYTTGLASLLFSSGPSGSFVINGWREVK